VSTATDVVEPSRSSTPAAAASRATPLELFFDLVYVFAFTQVTHLMADGESVRSVLGGLAVLGVLWWSWASHAWLANQQIADRGPVRIGILVAIAIVLVLSITIPAVFEESSRFGALVFSVGFVALSVVYTAVNLVVGRRDLALRRQVVRTMGITLVPVAAALIGGAVLGGTAQLVLWLAAVAIEGITIFTTSQGGAWQLPSAAHYAERHGLVVILALGESVISIGFSASDAPLSPTIVVAALVAVSVSLGMWWIYFSRVSPAAEHHISTLTGSRRTTVATIGTYVHFGIVAGILLVSLGLGSALEHLGAGHASEPFTWIATSGGLALFLAATATYARTTRSPHAAEPGPPRTDPCSGTAPRHHEGTP
jgi:low temperature requirement protein LtrA